MFTITTVDIAYEWVLALCIALFIITAKVMIMIARTDGETKIMSEYQNGFNDRIKGLPLDESRTADYIKGWWDANWRIQMID
jgi:hypothetical protein